MRFSAFHILVAAASLSLAYPDSWAQHVGDPADDVRAALGSPRVTRQAGEQEIWVYESGVKVTIENGLVTDVRGHGVDIPSRNPSPSVAESVPGSTSVATTTAVEHPSATAPTTATPPPKPAAPAKGTKRPKSPAADAGAAKAAAPPVVKEQTSGNAKWIVLSAMVGFALWMRWGNRPRAAAAR